MESPSTKERIAQVALDLFAKRGFYAVSIRDICGAVGIKESTVYYHYTNKQAIWDTLVGQVDRLIEEKIALFDQAFDDVESVSDEAMCQVAEGLLLNYFLNPSVHSVLAMLAMERMADEKADAEYRRIVFELPLRQQEKVFAEMMRRGIIPPGEPRILAAEYHGIVFLAYQKICVGGTLAPEKTQMACGEIRQNIADLYRKMRRDHP